MRWMTVFFAVFYLIATPTLAERRMALVVGNGAYGALGALPNPTADARLIADTLTQVGFDVTLLTDSDQTAMKRGIINFGRDLRNSGPDTVGLFFYAGHGIQARGRNYLLPVGGNIRDEADLDIEAVEANWVLRQMESAGNRTNIVVLDACRNNPFAGNFRSVQRGLARMDAPTGSFVAYATAPGGVAADGDGRNSPYSAALARAMTQSGQPIEQVFKKVRVEVLNQTGGTQTPWDSSSLTGDFYFMDGFGAAKPPAGNAGEIQLWNRVRASNDPGQFETFLAVYPNSIHASEARRRLQELSAPKVAAIRPQTPVQTTRPSQGTGIGRRTDGVSLRISTDWSISKPECSSPGDLGTVQVTLDENATPTRVAATNSDAALDFNVSARQHGGGAIITLQPLTGSNTRSIEVTLGSLAPGVSETEYSNVRVPGWGRCGGIQAQVRVLE